MDNRKAYSSVISSMILTTAVLVVGGSLWFFAHNASTITADNYVDGVIDIMNEISERFTVELVCYDGVDLLRIWVYNYGEVDIKVDIYADVAGLASNYSFGNEIMSGELFDISFSLGEISGKFVITKIVSRRDNYAYYTYLAP